MEASLAKKRRPKLVGVLWYGGTVVIWYCGTVVLWYCGTVVLW